MYLSKSGWVPTDDIHRNLSQNDNHALAGILVSKLILRLADKSGRLITRNRRFLQLQHQLRQHPLHLLQHQHQHQYQNHQCQLQLQLHQ